jgi:hypothetical protein
LSALTGSSLARLVPMRYRRYQFIQLPVGPVVEYPTRLMAIWRGFVWCNRLKSSPINMVERFMSYLFNKAALPITLVVIMIVWAWVSFLSVALSSLF